ncbi:MAG TPA: ATP-binding cassette domain-containing protein, partial [Telluria sp.]|nr:ATP-binding cassette domain-containing protein [Telluria sp.]
MADTPLATLHRVTYALPDGSYLFNDIDESLGRETVALIGRNGSGKTTLGRLVAGELTPSAGRIERSVAVHRVAQQAGPVCAASLAQLAQLAAPLEALRRVAAGDAR